MDNAKDMMNDPLYKEICATHTAYLLSILERQYGIRPSKRSALYQYTRMSSLCDGILGADREKGKEIVLRATSLGYMNDPQEVYSGVRAAKFILQNVFDSKDLLDEDEILDIRNNIYVTCFSKQRDYLPMWNMYGDNGLGISLLFDAQSICKAYPEHPFTCLYDNGDEIVRLLRRWLSSAEKGDNSLYEQYKSILPPGMSLQTLIFCVMMIIVKNRYYNYEKEVRVIVNDSNAPKFRVAGNMLIPYKERYLPKEALHEILIGPCNDPIRSKASLEYYLHCIGMDHVVVNISDVPYQIQRLP